MNLKRAFLIALAACILPGAALAQELIDVDVRFIVTKNFKDNNPGSVMVKLECNDGFVSQDGMAEITEDEGHTFIVSGLTEIEDTICEITEGGMDGYSAKYKATGDDDSNNNKISCLYWHEGGLQEPGAAGSSKTEDDMPNRAVYMGLVNTCHIVNRPDPVDITVSKDWDVTNSGGNPVEFYAMVLAYSEADIAGGYPCEMSTSSMGCMSLYFVGEDPSAQTVSVESSWKGTTVNFVEDVADSYVETENSCDGDVTVTPGETGASCAFMNSVFFEGIPTLSQYGMAIMALLMLGVGFVGFRRFI